MHRWTSLAFAVLVAGSMALVVVESAKRSSPGSTTGRDAKAASSFSTTAPALSAVATDGGVVARATGEEPHETGPFDTLPNGHAVPPLPADAPRTAGFGVILFTYRGAQGAAKDAPERPEALKRAMSVLAEARAHFEDAVNKGDRGSIADAGHIPRGVLEPAVEYALFTMQKGAVGDTPIDTPRGFWIIRRTD